MEVPSIHPSIHPSIRPSIHPSVRPGWGHFFCNQMVATTAQMVATMAQMVAQNGGPEWWQMADGKCRTGAGSREFHRSLLPGTNSQCERLRAPAGARVVCHIVGMMMTMTCMMGSRLESRAPITGQSLNLCQRLWPR